MQQKYPDKLNLKGQPETLETASFSHFLKVTDVFHHCFHCSKLFSSLLISCMLVPLPAAILFPACVQDRRVVPLFLVIDLIMASMRIMLFHPHQCFQRLCIYTGSIQAPGLRPHFFNCSIWSGILQGKLLAAKLSKAMPSFHQKLPAPFR